MPALRRRGAGAGGAVSDLVLSLFPGIGLLDMAFEEEGFVVVRGPDLLWGGDIKRFHPPAGKFDGVIGGPPCQPFAKTRNFHSSSQADLICEFVRCVEFADPRWWLMENVPGATPPSPHGYRVQRQAVKDFAVGGLTMRLRHFWFGDRGVRRFEIRWSALHTTDPQATVIAGGASRRRDGTRYRGGKNYGAKTTWAFARGCALQGLPQGFDLPAFTVRAKVSAIGNGVPLPMGRAVAQAVRRAVV